MKLDACAGDYDIETAKTLYSLGDGSRNPSWGAHVGGKGQRGVACCVEFGGNSFDSIRRQIYCRNGGAGSGHAAGCRCAYTAAGASDQGDFSSQHDGTLLCM
jgi:hypothetical protein